MIYNTAIVALCLIGHALAAPVPQGELLGDLAPDVGALVDGLGLPTLSPGLEGTLETLGADV
jgi:hypothetical protein